MPKPTYDVASILAGREAGLMTRIEGTVLGRWSDVLLCLLLGGKLEVLHMEAGNFAVITLPDVDTTYSTYWDNSEDPTEAELWEELCPPLSTGRQWTGYLLDQIYQRYQEFEIFYREWYEGSKVEISTYHQEQAKSGTTRGDKPCEAIVRHLLTVLQTPVGVG